MALEQGVDGEVGPNQRGDDVFGAVHVSVTDRPGIGPASRRARGIGRVGTEPRRMGQRDQEVTTVTHDPVDLPQDPVEVIDERERGDREGEIDLVGADERELGRVALMELGGDLVAMGEVAGGADLGDVGVGGRHPAAPLSEADDVVAGAAAQHEDTFGVDLADEPTVEICAQPGAELDVVERPVGAGSSGVIEGHPPSLVEPALVGAAPVAFRP